MQDNRPTWARRVLARFLRTCREDLGVRPSDAARDAGITPSTLSRIETGAVRVEVGTALLLMRNYDVPQDQQKVMEELAHSARRRGFWQRNKSGIPEWFLMYVNLESEAEKIRAYEPDLIPGFLQTPEYTTAIVESGAFPPKDEAETVQRIQVRGKRQSLILENETPSSVVLSESILHRIVGGKDVMRQQLNRLAEFQKKEHIDIRVLPFSRGDHPGNYGRFVILEFPEPHAHSVVYTEYAGGSIYLEEETEIETYSDMFARLQSLALSIEDSSDAITQAIDRL